MFIVDGKVKPVVGWALPTKVTIDNNGGQCPPYKSVKQNSRIWSVPTTFC